VSGFASKAEAGVARDLIVQWAWGLGDFDPDGKKRRAVLNLPHASYGRTMLLRVLECATREDLRAALHSMRVEGALKAVAAAGVGAAGGKFKDWVDPRSEEERARVRAAWRVAEASDAARRKEQSAQARAVKQGKQAEARGGGAAQEPQPDGAAYAPFALGAAALPPPAAAADSLAAAVAALGGGDPGDQDSTMTL
jgi:hypothetical protein